MRMRSDRQVVGVEMGRARLLPLGGVFGAPAASFRCGCSPVRRRRLGWWLGRGLS